MDRARRVKRRPPAVGERLRRLEIQGAQLMAITQAILDAQARLDAAIQANSTKLDEVLAQVKEAMTSTEQQQMAEAITASAVALEAINTKA
jgi:hypothetical protein